SEHVNDGLRLSGAYVTACVRCPPPGNRPLPEERDACLPYLARELRLIESARVIVCLGSFAYDGLAQVSGHKRRPKFGHGVETELPDGRHVICSFHPSQQNTFTRKLTQPMFDAIFRRARELSERRIERSPASCASSPTAWSSSARTAIASRT